jgi:hypothetical protein
VKGLARDQLVAGVLAIVVAAAVVAGIVVIGSPAEERARRLDERRIQDLSAIAGMVDLFWTRHSRLPLALDELRREPGSSTPDDPGSGMPYEYRPLEGMSFEVCARFERESRQDGLTRDGFWSHGAGLQCFRREVRKIG